MLALSSSLRVLFANLILRNIYFSFSGYHAITLCDTLTHFCLVAHFFVLSRNISSCHVISLGGWIA